MDPDEQELRREALEALGRAESLLRSAQLADHESDGWSPGLAKELADAFGNARLWIETGVGPEPRNLGYWVFRVLELSTDMRDEHKNLSVAAHEAGRAVERLLGGE